MSFVAVVTHLYGLVFSSFGVVDCDSGGYEDHGFRFSGNIEGFAVHVVGEGVDEGGFADTGFSEKKDVGDVGGVFNVETGSGDSRFLRMINFLGFFLEF